MTRDEVIKALELCRYDPDPGQEPKSMVSCDICPYWSDKFGCRMTDMFNDALALLKAQEPRVMTLHEIDDVINTTSKEYERIFWAEVRSWTRKSFGVFQLDIAVDDNFEALLLGCSWPACYNRSTYGIKWRCWTSRPTDAQREAAKWE